MAVELFNEGDYYQAHDVLEELWHHSSVRPKPLPYVSTSLALSSQRLPHGSFAAPGVTGVTGGFQEELHPLNT